MKEQIKSIKNYANIFFSDLNASINKMTDKQALINDLSNILGSRSKARDLDIYISYKASRLPYDNHIITMNALESCKNYALEGLSYSEIQDKMLIRFNVKKLL